MRVFVTGGTGFIGSHFINQAHAAGHDLVALRRSPQSKPRVPLDRSPVWLDCPMESVREEHLENCDCVVHLAAHSANVPYDSLENCIRQNVITPLQLFRNSIDAGIKRFIVAGSCFEYGLAGERHEWIKSDTGLEPTNSYPASKAAASVVFHALACEQALEMLILRIFQVYGEGEAESRFWPSLMKAAHSGMDFPMSDGQQIRDFINVTDVAHTFVTALERNDIKAGTPKIENLGTGKPMRLIDFAQREWLKAGARGNLIPGEIPQRANEVIRYVPQIQSSSVLTR